MADEIVQAPAAEVPETLHDRVYEIASRFVQGLSVLDIVIKYLSDSNTEELHAELANTLQLARDHMNAAHNDLDLLSGEIARGAQS
jgi:hypothetical protein